MQFTDLIAKYDRRVPRYTSYPTAPHFGAAVDPAVYVAWLADLPEDGALSLYLHVPFCASLCLFCACHTTVVHRPEPLLAYAATLRNEIDLVADAIGRRQTVRHIHWGGGTPTALPPAAMQAVMQRLAERFEIALGAEIAVEIDPRSLTEAGIEALARIGTNRVSLGVQDFDPAVQHAINRHQSLDLTARCAQDLRAAGIASINLDLIYGLPYQTEAGVTNTVRQALTLTPDRAAVFGYAHVPWMKKHQTLLPEAALPDAAERFNQRQAVEATLTAYGYSPIGLDHFARPDDALAQAADDRRIRRNFQGYTTDDAPVLVGLGASSIGSLPQGYVQNQPGVPAWREAIRTGRLPTARGVALTPDDRLRRDVIEQIMCHMAVDLREVAGRHGVGLSALTDAGPALQDMARDGLIVWSGEQVTVTPAGRPFVRGVASAFDTYLRAANDLRPGMARHSAAV